jgi:hypothetical protein
MRPNRVLNVHQKCTEDPERSCRRNDDHLSMISQSPRRMALFLNEIFYLISLSGISFSASITMLFEMVNCSSMFIFGTFTYPFPCTIIVVISVLFFIFPF